MYITAPLVGTGVASHYQTYDYICNKKHKIHTDISKYYKSPHINSGHIFFFFTKWIIKQHLFSELFGFWNCYTGFWACTSFRALSFVHWVSISFLDSADRIRLILTLIWGFMSPQPLNDQVSFLARVKCHGLQG